MKQLNLLGFLVIFLLGTNLAAQKTFSEGSVEFEITDISSDNPQVAAQIDMMKGSTMITYVKGDKQLTSMNMMNGMMQQNMIMDKENNSMIMLMDAMGRKIKVDMPLDDEQAENTDVDIQYFEDDRKEIAGHDTYKAILSTKADGQETEIETYITEAYTFDGSMIRNAPGAAQLRGLPLEYTISQPQIKMTFTAQNITESVDDSVFEFNMDDYEEMSQEDLQNMGGMGF